MKKKWIKKNGNIYSEGKKYKIKESSLIEEEGHAFHFYPNEMEELKKIFEILPEGGCVFIAGSEIFLEDKDFSYILGRGEALQAQANIIGYQKLQEISTTNKEILYGLGGTSNCIILYVIMKEDLIEVDEYLKTIKENEIDSSAINLIKYSPNLKEIAEEFARKKMVVVQPLY